MLLVKRILRRRPGQAFTILVLTLLAAAMAHTAIILLTDYAGNIDRKAEEWNAPSAIYVLTAGAPAERLADVVADDDAVDAVETSPSFGGMTTIDVDGENLTSLANVVDLSRAGRLGAPVVVEEAEGAREGIWVPSALRAAGAYSLGDDLTFDTTQGASTFRIVGFIEDLYGGASGMGTLTFGLDATTFAGFDAPGFQPTVNLKVQGADVTAASAAVDAALGKVQGALTPDEALYSWWSHDINIAKAASALSSSIFVAMLVALAGVIVVIAAVVTRFVLKNLIVSDLTSIGTLRAAGFTTAGIVGSLVAAYGALTALGAAVGSGSSYLLLPVMARAFHAQNGLSWQPRFSWPALVVTVAAMLAVVLVTATFAALRVRRVTTVGALRGGIANHSFTADRLPLATTRGRLSTLLGMKAGLRQAGQNVLLAVTVAIVAFAGVFTLGMVDNLLGDRDKATDLLVGTVEDVSVVPSVGADPEALLAEVEGLPGVQDAYFHTFEGLNVDGLAIAFPGPPAPAAQRLERGAGGGRPAHDNEIAIGGRLSTVLGLDVGDTHTLDLGAGEAGFVVTGVTSSARNLGQNVTISSDGYRRLTPTFRDSTIAVFADDPEQLIETAKERLGAQLDSVTNQRENVEAQLSSYLSMVPIISTFMISFVVVVTVLVVGLVVTTMLVQTHRELGIKKAMGFTNRELSAQTRWTYLPSIAAGAVVGSAAGALALSPLLTLLLSQLGILKVDAAADWRTTAAIALGILAIGAGVLWVSSLRIGRISAYALVTE